MNSRARSCADSPTFWCLQCARAARFAFTAVSRHRLRTALAMLALALGVACLALLAAVREGALRKASEIFQLYGTDAVFVIGTNVGSSKPGKRLRTITTDDVHAMRTALPQVQAVAPVRTRSGAQVRGGGPASGRCLVVGATAGYAGIWNWPLDRGRDIGPKDVAGSTKVAVIGHSVARRHFGDGPALGRRISVDGLPLTVVGVLAERGLTDAHGKAVDDRVIIPLPTLTKRFNLDRQTFMSMRVRFFDGTPLEPAMDDLRSLLRRRHRLRPGELNDFSVIGPSEIIAFRTTLERGMLSFLGLAAALALTAGGAVLANVLHITFEERRAEIGLRRALGAKVSQVLLQLLAEALLLGGGGAALGLGLGYAASAALRLTGIGPTAFSWSAFLAGSGAGLAVAVGAGLRPALTAARQAPVAALGGR